jgi:WD40 repeat protein
MSGERFDYSNERRRHERFVGRAALLAQLDRLLVADSNDRWVVVTGGPGMGKSAILSTWLGRREVAGIAMPHHFIRRGAYDWDDPAKLVGSLVAQIDDVFPELREPGGDERMHPATRLARALSRISEHKLRPCGERLVVLIDGLDEYDPPAGRSSDPLAAFLPEALPVGVSLLCSSRPRHPYVSSLEARDGKLVQIDLDDPDNAADNDATVRAFWERAAAPLGLDDGFVDEAVARAGGNVQHAVQLQKRLDALPPEQRRVEDIPRGLAALIAKSWERIATDEVAAHGLGILCAAREALTLDELGAVAGWTGVASRQAFVRAARELLVETLRPDGQPEYRLHHDTIRTHIAGAIGDLALRGHHGALAQRLATWPAPGQAVAKRYALSHALIHRAEAGDWAKTWQLAADMSFLEAKCRELGAHETEADVARIAELCRTSDDAVLTRRFGDLARALGRESHWLRTAPEASAALVWNRLRRSGWSADDLDAQLQVPAQASFLRVRHAITPESPSLVRDLVGHADGVTASAVTPDGRRVISASQDRTLKIWDLQSGYALATLEGHTDWVNACAVTPDGRRVVSASHDRTLKTWDLESGRQLATLEGHAFWVSGCAVTPDGRSVVSASQDGTLKVWDLESGRVLATLEGHATGMNGCAVTPDGRSVVSASQDGTLKVWDLESGRVLATLKGHAGGVMACAVTPDGRRVVSASQDRLLKVWDLESGRELVTLEDPRLRQRRAREFPACAVTACAVTACAVTPDGRRVVSASQDGELKVWDLDSGELFAILRGHAGWVLGCAVTPDGRRVVSASEDRTLKVWDLESEHASDSFLLELEIVRGGVNACAVTPDGRRVVSASGDSTMKVWDAACGLQLASLEGHTALVNACAVMQDGRRLVSGSDDGTLKVWDLDTQRELITLVHSHRVETCAVTPDSRHVVATPHVGKFKVWDVETGRELGALERGLRRGTARAVTPDSRCVVSALSDGTVQIQDLESGRPLRTLDGHSKYVTACVVTPDGRRVIVSTDQGGKIWDLDSGHWLANLEGHFTEVMTVCAVTPDGQHMVSTSGDGTLKVWDLETCRCILIHRGDAPYLSVSTSSTAIVAGDRAGGLWIFDWPPSPRRAQQHRSSGAGQGGSHPAHAPPSPRYREKKHTILFLAANPVETDRLALDREARAIQVELERSGHRDRFELVTRWAVEPLDLLRELRKLNPTVVHFSGHGGQGAVGVREPHQESRRDDREQQHGLFFAGPDGGAQLVTSDALRQTFGAAGSSVQLVVLNACYSDVQAEALLAHVDCVVGMTGSIPDDAARTFAIGFYGGLGENESVAAAHRQGGAAITLAGLGDTDRPQLRVRVGVNADQLILAADPS